MNYLGWLLALAGLLLASVLFARQDTSAILGLLAAAGPGLIVAALCHVVPMALNARAWQILVQPARARSRTGPSLPLMTRAVWVRESVNGLLPVARVGGELAAYRVLRLAGMRQPLAAAGLVVDMALSVMTQLPFALLGVGLLIAAGAPNDLSTGLLLGLLVLLPLGAAFIAVQRAGAFSAITRAMNRLVAGRLGATIEASLRIDRATRAIYGRSRALIACVLWQLAAWLAGAIEIWVALWFLGHPVSITTAVALEALIQAVSSAAFLVPAALGVQEAAFLVFGGALGLTPASALALAAARRLRDAVVFFPGLVAWQWAEARRGRTEQRR